MTWNDLVKKYIPDANNEECEYILWNKTPFPISMNVEVIKSYLKKYVEELKSSSQFKNKANMNRRNKNGKEIYN